MVLHPRNGLSLCAGAGGLDMGLMLAEPGFHTRCFVEWEPYPRDAIIAAQRAGYFAPAPIWDDVTTFDGRPLRGAIDTILAGYPCQPFSHAGQRKGADDERHLWPEIARIIREVEPEWVFLENVAGHVSLGAETVLRELWDMGWTPAAGLFSASETGAPHERLRWFCVAHRNSGERRSDEGAPDSKADWRHDFSWCGGNELAYPNGWNASAERQQRGWQLGFQPEGGGTGAEDVAHAEGQRHGSRGKARNIPAEDGRQVGCLPQQFGSAKPQLGHAPRLGRGEGRAEHGVRIGRDAATGSGGAMADASQPRQEGRELGRPSGERNWAAAPGPTAELRRACLFPPGPGDAAAWAVVLRSAPDMAPAAAARDLHTWARRLEADGREWWQAAAEPEFRRMVAGLSARSQPLRLLGNAVVPLQAALAWRSLASAHGLHPSSLGDEE